MFVHTEININSNNNLSATHARNVCFNEIFYQKLYLTMPFDKIIILYIEPFELKLKLFFPKWKTHILFK